MWKLLPQTEPEKKESEASEEASVISGWLPEEANNDSCFPALSRTQRLVGFILSMTASIFCFVLAYIIIPIIYVKARKFALLFSLGSLLFLLALAMLRGPTAFLSYMITGNKILLTMAYIATLLLTLYCAMGMRRTVPTIVAASAQIACLSLSLMGYIPGGMMGLKMLFRLSLSTARNVIWPVARSCIGRVIDV